jgi:hypothetical protein
MPDEEDLECTSVPDESFNFSLWNQEMLAASSDAGLASDHSSSLSEESGNVHSQTSWNDYCSSKTSPGSSPAAAESMWGIWNKTDPSYSGPPIHYERKWTPNSGSSRNQVMASWSSVDAHPVLPQDWAEEDTYERDMVVAGPIGLLGAGKVDPFATSPTKLSSILVAKYIHGKSPAQRFRTA